MLLCLPQVQKNSNKYCKSESSLSLPLLFAKNKEKYVEKSVALMTIFFVNSFVFIACFAKLSNDLVDFNFMFLIL
jgi:hypothetical protein